MVWTTPRRSGTSGYQGASKGTEGDSRQAPVGAGRGGALRRGDGAPRGGQRNATWRKAECALRQHASEGDLEALIDVAQAASNDYSPEEVKIMLAVPGTVRRVCHSLDGSKKSTSECGVTGVFVTSESSYDASLNRFKVVRLDSGIGGKYAASRREAAAIHFAVVEHHWDVVAYLYSEFGCGLSTPAACGDSALYMAVVNRCVPQMLQSIPSLRGCPDVSAALAAPAPPERHHTQRSDSPPTSPAAGMPPASATSNPLQDRAFLDSATPAGPGDRVSPPHSSRGVAGQRQRPTTAASFVIRHNVNRAGLEKLPPGGRRMSARRRGGRTPQEAAAEHKAAILRHTQFGDLVDSEGEEEEGDDGYADRYRHHRHRRGGQSPHSSSGRSSSGSSSSSSSAAEEGYRHRQSGKKGSSMEWAPTAAHYTANISLSRHGSGRAGRGGAAPEGGGIGETHSDVSSDVGGYNPLGKTLYDPEMEVQLREEKLRQRDGPRLTKARLLSVQPGSTAAAPAGGERRQRGRKPVPRHSCVQHHHSHHAGGGESGGEGQLAGPAAASAAAVPVRRPVAFRPQDYSGTSQDLRSASLAKSASMLRRRLDAFMNAKPGVPQSYPVPPHPSGRARKGGHDAQQGGVRRPQSHRVQGSHTERSYERRRASSGVHRPEEWAAWMAENGPAARRQHSMSGGSALPGGDDGGGGGEAV